jgi:hypothetical protein
VCAATYAVAQITCPAFLRPSTKSLKNFVSRKGNARRGLRHIPQPFRDGGIQCRGIDLTNSWETA